MWIIVFPFVDSLIWSKGYNLSHSLTTINTYQHSCFAETFWALVFALLRSTEKKLYFESLLKHNHTILVIFTLEATNLKSTPTTDYIQHLESWAPPKNKFIYWYCCHLSVLYSSIELHWVRTDFLQPWTVCLGTMHFIFMSLHAMLMFAKQHVKSDPEFSTSMHA